MTNPRPLSRQESVDIWSPDPLVRWLVGVRGWPPQSPPPAASP